MNRPWHWLASLLVGCITPLSAGDLKQTWSPRQPSWPALVVNQEPDLCASMLKVSEEWFSSEAPSVWAPGTLFAGLDEVTFGEEQPLKAGFAYQRELDLDADGVSERVLLKGTSFRDEISYQGFVAAASTDMNALLQSDTWSRKTQLPGGVVRFPVEEKLVAWESSRDKGIDWATSPYPLFQWRKHYYFSGYLTESAESGLALYRLKGDGSTPLVCLVRSRAARDVSASMVRMPEIKALLTALENIGTAGRSYCGTLNSGGLHDAMARASTHRAAVRPWAVSRTQEIYLANAHYFEYAPRMWKFLEYWAAADSWNKREYLTLLQTLEPARAAYARYLVREFGLPDAAARAKGEKALNEWIAAWVLMPESFDAEDSPDIPEAPYPSDERIATDPKQANEFGKTNLMMAAHLNRIDLVRELLKSGSNPNEVTTSIQECGFNVMRGARTALSYAAENASPLVMKLLLDAGASPAMKDTDGNGMSFYLQRNPRLSHEQLQLSITELAASATSMADAPGFNCTRATRRTERVICGHEVLRLLDAEMSQAYANALTTPAVGLQADQRRWTAWRETNCAKETGAAHVECLAGITAARERYLQYLATDDLPER